MAFLSTPSITRPLAQVVQIARRVADGDLTSHIAVDRRDEAGQMMGALRHMNASLIRIVGEVCTSTGSMSGVSGVIASGNLDLSAHRSPGQFPGPDLVQPGAALGGGGTRD